MSHTLNLVAGLLEAARGLQKVGRFQSAADLLERLAAFRQLAPMVAEEVHARLAEVYGAQERFKKARRHLAIALTFRPQHAAYHNQMAAWIEADPDAAIDRAGRYHRRAVRCAPEKAAYWVDYGAFLIDAGQTQAGRRALGRAFRLAGHDAELVGRIAATLRDGAQWEAARTLLRRAQFQNSGDRRFQTLYQQHQFAQLHKAQQSPADAAAMPPAVRPVLLPFLRMERAPATVHVDGKTIRFDRAVDPAAATLPLPKHRSKRPGHRRTK